MMEGKPIPLCQSLASNRRRTCVSLRHIANAERLNRLADIVSILLKEVPLVFAVAISCQSSAALDERKINQQSEDLSPVEINVSDANFTRLQKELQSEMFVLESALVTKKLDLRLLELALLRAGPLSGDPEIQKREEEIAQRAAILAFSAVLSEMSVASPNGYDFSDQRITQLKSNIIR